MGVLSRLFAPRVSSKIDDNSLVTVRGNDGETISVTGVARIDLVPSSDTHYRENEQRVRIVEGEQHAIVIDY